MLDRERPDFVDIVTRPETHGTLVALAASRGIPVICQKPMAPTWDDCVTMVQTCEKANVRLLIHENWRWQPWYRQMRRLIDDGVLGEPFQATCYWKTGDGRGSEPYTVQPYFRQMPRLLVYEALVHPIDTFRYLVGEIQSVYCQMKRLNPVICGEDWAVIQFQFQNGAHGLIDANRISGPAPPGIAMGTFCLEASRGKMRISEDGRLWITEYGQTERPHEYPIRQEGYRGDSVRALQQHLADCLRTNASCESEAREYLKTVAAVFACYQSADRNQPVARSEFQTSLPR